jgi:hypothetical protein
VTRRDTKQTSARSASATPYLLSEHDAVPVGTVRQAALRALHAYLEDRQRTVLLHIGDLDLNGLRNIGRPFADDVHAFTRDYLAEGLEGDSDGLDAAVSRIVTVRRLLVTASQVEELVPESARIESTGAERMAG